MSKIHFDKLHSVSVDGTRFSVIAVAGTNGYEFTLDQSSAALLVAKILSASKSLAETDQATGLDAIGIQPVVASDLVPGIQINLGGEWNITIRLHPKALDDLLASISELKRNTSFDESKTKN